MYLFKTCSLKLYLFVNLSNIFAAKLYKLKSLCKWKIKFYHNYYLFSIEIYTLSVTIDMIMNLFLLSKDIMILHWPIWNHLDPISEK